MVYDLDLDIVNNKMGSLKLNGEDRKFKEVTVKEHMANEMLLQDLDKIQLDSQEHLDEAGDIIVKYITSVVDMSEDEAAQISIAQFNRLRQFMQRKDMYDQGFNDKEIDLLEKKALKKQMAQLG
jgi:hypothetical protein